MHTIATNMTSGQNTSAKANKSRAKSQHLHQLMIHVEDVEIR